MATAEELKKLLSIPCPFCGALVGEVCFVQFPDPHQTRGTRRWKPVRLSTLDGGCHDARWQKAVGRPAKVTYVHTPPRTRETAGDGATASAGAGSAPVLDRPW